VSVELQHEVRMSMETEAFPDIEIEIENGVAIRLPDGHQWELRSTLNGPHVLLRDEVPVTTPWVVYRDGAVLARGPFELLA
jgi:hypothetical protein